MNIFTGLSYFLLNDKIDFQWEFLKILNISGYILLFLVQQSLLHTSKYLFCHIIYVIWKNLLNNDIVNNSEYYAIDFNFTMQNINSCNIDIDSWNCLPHSANFVEETVSLKRKKH